MDKQQKIREGIARAFYYATYPNGAWRYAHEETEGECFKFSDEILTYLHFKGVVILVDKRYGITEPLIEE